MTAQELIYKMITQNTGSSLGDSGGYPTYNSNGDYETSSSGYGRHHEFNRGKSLEYFQNSPEVVFDKDFGYTVSTFHYLANQLDLDDFCNKFNRDYREDAESWLQEQGYEISGRWYNSYNSDSRLSQHVQYAIVKEIDSLNEEGDYVLIQTHNGCDIRGGYSDAKLFVPQSSLENYGIAALLPEEVYGTVRRGKKTLSVSNTYNGYTLTIDSTKVDDEDLHPVLFEKSKPVDMDSSNNEDYEYQEGDIVELHIIQY